MSSKVLSDRTTNTQINTTMPKEGDKPKTMEYHRQVLEQRMQESQDTPNYVSPSDTIMSPATQKLAAFKNKHMAKGGSKPRSLFAQTAAKNANAAGSLDQGMFADIQQK